MRSSPTFSFLLTFSDENVVSANWSVYLIASHFVLAFAPHLMRMRTIFLVFGRFIAVYSHINVILIAPLFLFSFTLFKILIKYETLKNVCMRMRNSANSKRKCGTVG